MLNIKNLAKQLSFFCKELKYEIDDILIPEIQKKEQNKQMLSYEIGAMFSFYVTFKENITICSDIDDFSDTVVQIIVFSALLSKITSKNKIPLSITNLEFSSLQDIGIINGILRYIKVLYKNYQQIQGKIDNILDILNKISDIDFIFSNNNNESDQYLDFYNTFLTFYDKEKKHQRGIFYTPQKIAEFIVREVDYILKEYFYYEDGISDIGINILDFACGTGTFIAEIYKRLIRLDQETIKNIYGFELMIIPYIIAHLRLASILKAKHNILLTNTLEFEESVKFSSIQEIVDESKIVAKIKKKTINVILGNPPYSIKSYNNSKDINTLINNYFYIDGIKQKNTQSLNDDYVKFVRFAEEKLLHSQTGGIFAAVLNHGFVDNPSFSGMRKHLLSSFDDIYIIDINGNFRRQKIAKSGKKDENLLPVKQGICIAFFIKKFFKEDDQKRVFFKEIIGDKKSKIETLMLTKLSDSSFTKSDPKEPFYSFKPIFNSKRCSLYDSGINITDIFLTYGSGITTSRDNFAMDISQENLIDRLQDFLSCENNIDLYKRYNLKENANSNWDIYKIKKEFANIYSQKDIKTIIKSIHFRGFDIRYVVFDKLISKSIGSIMYHMLNIENNIGLCFSAREIDTKQYSSIFVTKDILSSAMHYYGAKIAPMYIIDKENNIISNFNPEFLSYITNKYKQNFSTEAIFEYVYGSFYVNNYSVKYCDFLSINYPKIIFYDNFAEISKIGQELIDIHLLKKKNKTNIEFIGNNFIIDNIRYICDKLYINDVCYFNNISKDIYEFKIGCYPVLQKWLKSRSGKDIKNEITYVISVAEAIKRTIEISEENIAI